MYELYEYVRFVRYALIVLSELPCLLDAIGDGRSAKAIAHSPETCCH